MWIKIVLVFFVCSGKHWQSKKIDGQFRSKGNRKELLTLFSQSGLRSWRQKVLEQWKHIGCETSVLTPGSLPQYQNFLLCFCIFMRIFQILHVVLDICVCVFFFFLRTPNHKLPIYIFCFIILMIKTKDKKIVTNKHLS